MQVVSIPNNLNSGHH